MGPRRRFLLVMGSAICEEVRSDNCDRESATAGKCDTKEDVRGGYVVAFFARGFWWARFCAVCCLRARVLQRAVCARARFSRTRFFARARVGAHFAGAVFCACAFLYARAFFARVRFPTRARM